MSAFILPFRDSIKPIAFYLTVAIVLGWGTLLLWSGFGSNFKKVFIKHDKIFRAAMSLLLVYSAVTIFL
ncbi:hypothetical protein [Oceanobacillus sp. FSL W7-1309]|uniref:hypothetical protein n=1 Tax=Oceanobacillus sp. FSL W7-1309 TaxID=2954539 RepID=UPI0030F754E6